MKITLVLACALCLVAMASARPKYIAIPAEDIQFLSFSPSEHHRVAREAVYEVPSGAYATEEEDDEIETAASNERPVRQAGNQGDHHGDHHGDDHVDYGAHTGHHGAFGWYADYPVYTQGH